MVGAPRQRVRRLSPRDVKLCHDGSSTCNADAGGWHGIFVAHRKRGEAHLDEGLGGQDQGSEGRHGLHVGLDALHRPDAVAHVEGDVSLQAATAARALDVALYDGHPAVQGGFFPLYFSLWIAENFVYRATPFESPCMECFKRSDIVVVVA